MINIRYAELGLISRNTAESMLRGRVAFRVDGLSADDFELRMDRLLTDEWGLYCVKPVLNKDYAVVLFEKLTAEAKAQVLALISSMQAAAEPATTSSS